MGMESVKLLVENVGCQVITTTKGKVAVRGEAIGLGYQLLWCVDDCGYPVSAVDTWYAESQHGWHSQCMNPGFYSYQCM